MRPTILIAEVHMDPSARQLVHDNLTFFEKEGYNLFAFEHDFPIDLKQEIRFLQKHIDLSEVILKSASPEVLLENFISLWSVPSNRVLLDLFKKIDTQSNMRYQGLDNLGVINRWGATRDEIQQMATPEKNTLREEHMACELVKISEQGAGLAIIGLSHVKAIQERLIETLGLAEAQKRFVVLIPYSYVIPSSKLDSILSLVYEQNRTELMQEFPLRQCNFFGTEPTSMAEFGIDLNTRFKQFVSKKCLGIEIETEDNSCCNQYTQLLLRFFTPAKMHRSEALNQYLSYCQEFEQVLMQSSLRA